MIGLKIPKNMANDVRKILLNHSLLNLDARIKRDNDFVIFPLNEKPDQDMQELIGQKCEIIETAFEKQKKGPRSLKDYLKGKIDDETIDEIRGSFDIIGDVVILEIPDDLEDYKELIGEAALKFTKRKAIFRKTSEIKGIIRTRELEHIAGEDISETVHQEFGCRLMLDVRNVYFSPRLATERKRVADSVKGGEVIVDMFAGVAPFPVLIAKNHDVMVYAIDINPEAYKYAEKNIELNKVQDKVIPILGDVREVLENKDIKADRIIMNLPGSAYEFLDTAVQHIKPGGIIHYYEFSESFEKPIARLKEAAYPRKVEILDKRKVRSRSPGKWHMGIDVRVF
ncbi:MULTISPECIES: class I SAM-dependent methyltransferase [Methanobacterium]|jgi:tRNA (guanine37-N1)-methyltransferase|uniref:tRNA (guanine(37)-N(1))-methyltransferase n=1 Tax=Methanobacterium bryantii TaxID=2161 RepID=A0A2A2H4A9_METBR|nr:MULTISPECIES: class I SAM-dependent methyltransferase family protein [Methanobacterium]OEC87216.1 SAM-dependent methyltransferase [Methanobacterium sp. A39]PAV04238.1 SAM-dependent methyltransferase [Methanobacterium bryantii]